MLFKFITQSTDHWALLWQLFLLIPAGHFAFSLIECSALFAAFLSWWLIHQLPSFSFYSHRAYLTLWSGCHPQRFHFNCMNSKIHLFLTFDHYCAFPSTIQPFTLFIFTIFTIPSISLFSPRPFSYTFFSLPYLEPLVNHLSSTLSFSKPV